MTRKNKPSQIDFSRFALRILPQIRSAFVLWQRKILPQNKYLKTFPKNMFPKSFPAISHDHFSDQKNSCAISHNYLSIQIKGQYILHRSLFDQKNGITFSHDPFSIQIEG